MKFDKSSSLPSGWACNSLGMFLAGDRAGIEPLKYPDEEFELYSIPFFDSRQPETTLGINIGSNKQIVHPGRILLSKINPRINRVWIVSNDSGLRQIASTEWIAFEGRDAVQPKYLSYYLQRNDFRDYLSANVSGVGGSLMRVKSSTVSDYPFNIAPYNEQTRIVSEIEDQFSLLDAAVCALKRVQANLKRYRASVLQAACEGRLVPTEAELARAEERDYEAADKLLERILATRQPDLRAKSEKPDLTDKSERAELPEGWCWTTLGQVFKVYVGATPSRAKPEYWHGEISWVSSGEVAFCRIRDTREKVTELGLRNASTEVHPPGTVLLGMIGEGKTRGQTAILDIPACNNQNCAAIRVSETPVPPNYVYRFLEGQYAKTRKVGGGNNQPALNKRTVSNIDLPLPPIAEQYRIVEELERILSNVDSMEVTVRQSLLRADRLRQSILKKAFEGKLVPQDPNDESASVLLERIRSERNDRKLELKARRVMVKK